MYQQIFKLHADVLRAISHPKRLEIIHLLRDQSLSVTDIQKMLGLPQANLSQHLQVLRENNIVTCSKKGKHIYYRVTHPNYFKACDLLREVLILDNKDKKIYHQLKNNLSDLLPIGIDPICGMKLTSKTAAFIKTINDSTYYFCASGCLGKFKHHLQNINNQSK